MTLPWKQDFKQYHFEIFFHVGRKCFGVEVYNYKKNWLEENTLDFKTFDEAYRYLSKYGYCNILRFLLE